jgi:hypothetical protein
MYLLQLLTSLLNLIGSPEISEVRFPYTSPWVEVLLAIRPIRSGCACLGRQHIIWPAVNEIIRGAAPLSNPVPYYGVA